MTSAAPAPRLDHLDPDAARRVQLTVSCRDTDVLAKVAHAGEVTEHDGVPVQIMHNGLMVEEGCYYGPWMTEIIRALRGHHEPQEEVAFHHVVERLAQDEQSPAMIELGSFWTYYGMWFIARFPQGRLVAMEPDPAYLEVGRRNWKLNALPDVVEFVRGAVGARPGEELSFTAESDGLSYRVRQYDLHALMTEHALPRIDLVLSDVQGAESILLDRARGDFAAGRVRFVVISTHHHAISGSPLTHQRALQVLRESGAHIVAEHSVPESFSGDGLIVASFDARDRGWTLDISRARAVDSLFGELEADLDRAWQERAAAERARDVADAEAADAARRLAVAERELAAIRATKLWRAARMPRAVYGRFRIRSR